MRPFVTTVLIASLAACAGETSKDATADVRDDARLVAEASLGPVTATLWLDPKEPRFGERVELRLEVDASENATLEPTVVGSRLGHFRVRGQSRDGDEASGDVTYVIEAEPEKTGVNIGRLPPIRFRVESGENAGTEQELRIAPFDVEVAGLASDMQVDLADLGTPLSAVRLPLRAEDQRTLWLSVGAALLVLVGGFWMWRRSRRVADLGPPPVPPGEEAARAFDELLARDLIAKGEFAEFYVGLTGIVRRYIERTTGIHAPEQTTEEFLRAMERDASFDGEQRRKLDGFLAACDLVKFAAQVPSETEVGDAVRRARAFCGLEGNSSEAAA